jgi:pectin methylesterase-like acyl-CoA thioesterase
LYEFLHEKDSGAGRMLKMPISFVLDSLKFSACPGGCASGFGSPAALLSSLFEHPAGARVSCLGRAGSRSNAILISLNLSLLVFIMVFGFFSFGLALADEGPLPGPRTLVVALDGTGDYVSLQEAVDAAKKGDTVFVKAGHYPQDVTIHSKEKIKFVGAGVDRVTILGRDIVVGALHVGKWPYGATDIEISDMTINDRGGHAVGLFNGQGIVLRRVKINGMLFSQQVHDVRIEDCVIGGSETTGAQFADSEAVLIGNVIHDNDHGVSIAGKSNVRLERNVIIRSLFEAIVVSGHARAELVSNTLVKNGGGAAFLGQSKSHVTGNVVGLNQFGFVIAPSSLTATSFNAFYNSDGDYLRADNPNQPAPELKAQSDITGDPYFVDPEHDDFRLRFDTPLLKIGQFPYLGALAPASNSIRETTIN